LPRSKDEDRELQIELTRLQIEHEHKSSMNILFLSVFASVMLANISIYIPLGVTFKNNAIIYAGVAYALVVAVPFLWLLRRTLTSHDKLDEEIKELKDRFLSKQAEEKKAPVL
jgi:cadmium resistance protein CadD (predicted permease)